jgi:hypothetical protein
MSADPRARLREAASRLDEISALLASGETDDSAAVELAREAAQIAADAGALAAEAARAVAAEGSDST